jgi:acyl-CoA synthetase (NDP forming)
MDRAATESVPELVAEEARVPEASVAVAERRGIADALLRPRAVALIGVGNDPERPYGRPLHLLRWHGFAGPVYPISPARRVIQGAHAYPDLATLPGPVDLAMILYDGEAAITAVEACGRAQIATAVIARPFAEPELAARLAAAARTAGLRLLGPGAGGVIVPGAALALAAEEAFAARELRPGRFLLIADSGSAMGALFSRAGARGLGFAALIAPGAELDLSIGEIGAAAVDEPEADAFLLYLDRIRHPAALARFAAAAHAVGKPIVVYKNGAAGTAAAEFLRAHGIVRVETLDALLELAPLLVRRRPGRGRTAGLVSTAGCIAHTVADRLAAAGVSTDGLDDLARQRLSHKGVPVTAGAVAEVARVRPEAVRAALDEALEAPNTDAVLAVLGAGAETDAEAAVAPVIAAAQRADKPLAALVVPEAPAALERLAAAGIAAFRTPEAAADGLRAFLNWAPPSAPHLLWEDGAFEAQRVLHAGQAMQIFRLLGIAMPTMLWLKRDMPVPSSLPFPPPYVVKVLSPDLAHRLELGGVALGLETITAVRAAGEEMLARVAAARPDAFLDGLAIQRLERGLVEVAIGFRRDPEAGPVVTLTMGEGLGELYFDRALRLAPIDRATAYDMIDEVKGLAPARGHRNRARGDLDALAQALVAVSSFALIASPRVLAAAVDPLLVRAEGQGVVALDGFVTTE